MGSSSITPSEPSTRRCRRPCVPFEQTVTVRVVRGQRAMVSVWLGVPSGSPGAGITIEWHSSGIRSSIIGRTYSMTWHVSR